MSFKGEKIKFGGLIKSNILVFTLHVWNTS